MQPHLLTTLPNGARIATIEMPHMQSVSVGIWAAVGGRYEPKAVCGISHFIEHLMFKGTEKRSARKITEAVEGLGGYLKAFTTEDHTCYYAKAGAAHLRTVCDVLGDMYLHSRFAPAEIEKEREVIREEILMYLDNPGQHVQELLSDALWPDHPLGRPLTGTVKSISGPRPVRASGRAGGALRQGQTRPGVGWKKQGWSGPDPGAETRARTDPCGLGLSRFWQAG